MTANVPPPAVTAFSARCQVSGIGLMRPRISLRNRNVYFPISKAANSTIKWMLYELEVGGKFAGGRKKGFRNVHSKMLVHDNFFGPLLIPWQIPANSEIDFTLAEDPSYTRFTFVRNPYTRILSGYLDRAQRKNSGLHRMVCQRLGKEEFSFKEMLEAILDTPDEEREVHARTQASQTGMRLFENVVVGRFETLAEDFTRLAASVYPGLDHAAVLAGFEGMMASPARTGAAKLLRDHYDAESAEMVQAAYRPDFEELSYSTELEELLSAD